MTKRRMLGMFLLGGILLATGAVPAGAAPAPSASAALAGPISGPCDGPVGTNPVGTVVIQSGKPKGAMQSGERALRVSVTADKVRPRTSYNVVLATTVEEAVSGGIAVGCRFWSVGTAESNANGRLSFSGGVTVSQELQAFNVNVVPTGPAGIGYTTKPVGVAGL